MNRLMRTSLRTLTVLATLATVLFAVGWLLGGTFEPYHLVVDSDGFSVPAGHGLGGALVGLSAFFAALAVVVLVTTVVLPVVLVVGVGVPLVAAAFALTVALVATSGALLLALSPILLPIALAWGLLRRRPAASSTTIVG